MTRTIHAVVALLLATITMNAQQSISIDLNVKSTNKVPTTPIAKGAELTINSVTCDMSNQKGYNYILGVTTQKGEYLRIDLSKVHQMPIDFSATNKDEYWYARSIKYSLPSLASMTDVYSMRNKAETKANQFVGTVRNDALTIEDPYLTAYINSLLAKINPSQRLDFFKYNFKVIVLKDDEPNASIYPNGALIINAGMLARIHTEDELVALLCHEANHFICNHYLDNMAKIQKREVAGAIGSAVLGTAAGILTKSAGIGLSTTTLSMSMANDINALITAMGLAFNQDQEKESDHAAVDLLPLLGYDRNAMSTCIQKIGNYYMEEGNLAAYYKSGNHPKIEDRIASTGIPYDRRDTEFEKKMSPCISYVAQVLFGKGRYSQALELADRNIHNGAGRGMDFYIKGECLLAAQDTEESNMLARESLLKARETYTDGLPTLKALIVSDIRLGMFEEARNLLSEFREIAKDKEEERIWADGMLINIAQ
ncbi:MAG: M48 family metallopeptidase [Bacteroidales bacterium]|nr:M48 family metallopeptidase [Candidatus Cryptobacteroides caccocaballi]